jgi:hypothetical protein
MDTGFTLVTTKARASVIGALIGVALMCLLGYTLGANPNYVVVSAIGAIGGLIIGGVFAGPEIGPIGAAMVVGATLGLFGGSSVAITLSGRGMMHVERHNECVLSTMVGAVALGFLVGAALELTRARTRAAKD